MAKIILLQITQMQIVVRHFLTSKPLYLSIARVDLYLQKSPNKKMKLCKDMQHDTNSE